MLPILRSLSERSAALKPTLLSQAISGLFARKNMPHMKKGMTMNKHIYGSGALLLALQSGMAMAQSAPAVADAGTAAAAQPAQPAQPHVIWAGS